MKKLLYSILALILILFPISVYGSGFNDYVVGAFHFDETSGSTVIDSSGNINLSLTAVTVNQASPMGTSYLFDGSDGTASYVTLSEDEDYNFANDDFTITGWFQPRAKEQSYPTMFSSGCASWGAGCFILRHSHEAETNEMGLFHHEYGGFKVIDSGDVGLSYALGFWHMFAIVKRSQVLELWMNGQNINNISANTSLPFDTSINSAGILGGDTWDGRSADFDGYMDEVTFFKGYALTPAEIIQIYDTNDTYPFTVPTAPNIIEPALYNTSDDNISTLFENQPFYFAINYTLDGVQSDSGECNITADNVSAVFFSEGANISLDGSNQVQLIVSEGVTNLLNDDITFRVCRESAVKKPVQIIIDSVEHRELDQNLIPLCTDGFHEEVNVTTAYNADSSLNVSIQCDSCIGTNTIRVLSIQDLRDNDWLLKYQRNFDGYDEDLTFNITSLRYEYNNHLSSFSSTQSQSINFTCNGTSQLYTYTPLGENLTCSIDLIQDVNGEYSFTPGINVQSGDINITGDCFGDIVQSISMNVSYSNGTLAQSLDTEFGTFLNGNLGADDIYTIDLCGVDDENTVNCTTSTFVLNDTVSPTAVWVSPLSSNLTTLTTNETLSIDITALDTNLYSINITCLDNLSVQKFYFYSDAISSPYQHVNNTDTISNLGVGICTLIVKDWHTDNDITDLDLDAKVTQDLDITFEYLGVGLNISTIEDISDMILEKKKDRYTFEPILAGTRPNKFVYYVECTENMRSYYDNQFGWILSCGEFWIDFVMENLDLKQTKVIEVSDTRYRVELKLNDNMNSLKTKSVGVKNTLTETVQFEVKASVPVTESQELSDSDAMIFIGLVLLYIAMIFLGFVFGQPGFILFAGVLGIIMGIVIVLSAISMGTVIGITFALFNSVLMVVGIYATRE